MRRARIKAVATVPARRKPIKDENSDSPKSFSSETNERSTETTVHLDNLKKIPHSSTCEPNNEDEPKEFVDAPKVLSENLELSECIVEAISNKDKEVSERNSNELRNTSEARPTNRHSKIIEHDSSRCSEEANITIDLDIDENELEKSTKDSGEEAHANSIKNKGVSEKNFQELKNTTEEITISRDSKIIEHDNSHGSEGAKISSDLDTVSVAKVSQTRTSFMRPTPRLDGGGGRIRRNSVQGSGASASESEEDCRRVTTNVLTNRVRNDSVGSTHSPKGPARDNTSTIVASNSSNTIGVSGGGAGCPSPGKNMGSLNARQKRKMIISESARKLAEARREFLLKYENKQPDRTKLTMYDLIYYNPVTNPLKKSEKSVTTQRNASLVTSAVTKENDDDDDEEEEEEEEKDECEMNEGMPVPQVKVGPDGHLILDEQSLVIEHTGAKKNRQALAKTEALVDDENNGTGFYKKRPKTKDWPKWETLKFYKALNSVGTDFLLMQSLFPKRSRQEIKMKFKKEERTNRRFVEKALSHHKEFDIELLKEDLATFDESENKQPELKSEKSSVRRTRGPKRKRGNKLKRMAALSIEESIEDLDELAETTEQRTIELEYEKAKSRGKKRKGVQRKSVETNDVCIESARISSESESEREEIYNVKPTRSGRLPKVRKLQAPTINTLDKLFSDSDQDFREPSSPDSQVADLMDQRSTLNLEDDTTVVDKTLSEEENNVSSDKSQQVDNSIPDIAQVEPGSLVIVSRESADEPGETVLQVYMVSSDTNDSSGTKKNMTPVVLTPELLNTVTAGITKVAPVNVDN